MLPDMIPICDPCLKANLERWGRLDIRPDDTRRWCRFCLGRRAFVVVKSEAA